MVKLDQLKRAFSEIEKLSRKEETFHIGEGVAITVRPNSEEESVFVWKFASVALEDGSEDAAAERDFIHRLKVATLGSAIVQINDQDLRGPSVDTGETHEGKPVMREKSEVVRDFLKNLPEAWLNRMFARYGDFLAKVEIEAERGISFNPIDINSEIERLTLVIDSLRKKQEEADKRKARDNPLPEIASRLGARATSNAKLAEVPRAASQEETSEAPETAAQVAPAFEQEDVASGRDHHEQVTQALQEPELSPEEEMRRQNAAILSRKRQESRQLQAHEEMLEERQRDIEARRQAKLRRNQSPQSAGAPVQRHRRTPPHAAAVKAAEKINGIDVYQQPPVELGGTPELSPRGQNQPRSSGVLDPDVRKQAVNPKFRNPRG